MLDLVRKTLRAGAVCAAAVAVAAGGAIPAYAQGANTLALPVEFNDFNADNVLFEYSIDGRYPSGLENLGTGSGQGLVEPVLGANGNPVYARAAVENAARAMAAELNGAWTPTAPKQGVASLYAALQADYRSATSSSRELMAGDGAAAVTFGGDAWTAQGTGYTAAGETLYKGAGPVWKQDNDGVLGYSHGTPLTRTYTAQELLGADASTFNHRYVVFDMWNSDQNAAGLTVTMSCGGASKSYEIKKDTAAPQFQWYVDSAEACPELTLTITPNEDASTVNPCRAAAVRVAASDNPILNDDGGWMDAGVTWHTYQLGRDEEDGRFYNQGWHAYKQDGSEFSYQGQLASDGSIAWVKEGDGVVAREAGSTITRTFDVDADTAYRAKVWNATPGMKVALYAGEAAEGEPLAVLDAGDAGSGWIDGPVLSVPTGQSKITVALTSTVAGNKIAALHLVSLGSASKLGDYDATVAKYADGSKGLEDATSCMDYAYCVLNHLFDEEALTYKGLALKTPVEGRYNSITLTDDSGDGGYSFVADALHSAQKSSILEPDAGEPADGFKDLKYDLASGTIENVAAGQGDDRAGFFPLDGLAGGQTFDAQFEYSSDAERADRVAAMGAHNYHYTMASRSEFTYVASKNQFFTFEGDDDTYLFINNKLVIDLGGAHTAQKKTVELEGECALDPSKTWAEYLGLVDGESYSFDFFYMERHTDYSDFAVNTNIALARRSLGLEAGLETDAPDGGFNEGDELEYKVVVKNTGTGTVKDIKLAGDFEGATIDYEKSGIGEGGFSLRAGESQTIYVRYTVKRSDLERGGIEAPFVAEGVDGRSNEVKSNEGVVTAAVAALPEPEPGVPGEPGTGAAEGTTRVDVRTTKTVTKPAAAKAQREGLAHTGDREVFLAAGVALLGGLIASLGLMWSKTHRRG